MRSFPCLLRRKWGASGKIIAGDIISTILIVIIAVVHLYDNLSVPPDIKPSPNVEEQIQVISGGSDYYHFCVDRLPNCPHPSLSTRRMRSEDACARV